MSELSDEAKKSLTAAEATEQRRLKAVALARLDAADAPEDYARFYEDLGDAADAAAVGRLEAEGDHHHHHHHPDEKAMELFVDKVCRRLYPPMPLLDILYDAAYRVGAKTLVNGVPSM